MKLLNELITILDEKVEPKDVDLKIAYHETLNPALWDGDKLKPKVRDALMRIADLFEEYLDIPNIKVTDVILTGSNANYNWTALSDCDLHVICDLKDVRGKCEDLLTEFLFSKKKVWNDNHDMTIYGYDVELYTQDVTESLTAAGIYSLQDNKWLTKPTHNEPKIDDGAVRAKAASLMNKIDDFVGGDVSKVERIHQFREKIAKLRKSGLERAGEFSTENLVFKVLRNNGYLEKLQKVYNSAVDKKYSLV